MTLSALLPRPLPALQTLMKRKGSSTVEQATGISSRRTLVMVMRYRLPDVSQITTIRQSGVRVSNTRRARRAAALPRECLQTVPFGSDPRELRPK